MDENKKRALAAALGQIEKQFGKGAVMRMGDHDRQAIPAISTGSLGLDIALGIGGLPKGRIVEIYGPESSGKTTLTLSVIAEAQKLGATCAFVDAEHALDPEYAGKLGVNVDDLLVSQPDTGEQALEITDMLVRSNAVDVIVIDSVAALVPNLAHSIFAETLQGLSRPLEAAGLELLVAASGYDIEREESQIRTLLGWAPRALVITGRHHTPGALKLLREAHAGGCTVIEMWDHHGRGEQGFAQVGFNHRAGLAHLEGIGRILEGLDHGTGREKVEIAALGRRAGILRILLGKLGKLSRVLGQRGADFLGRGSRLGACISGQ